MTGRDSPKRSLSQVYADHTKIAKSDFLPILESTLRDRLAQSDGQSVWHNFGEQPELWLEATFGSGNWQRLNWSELDRYHLAASQMDADLDYRSSSQFFRISLSFCPTAALWLIIPGNGKQRGMPFWILDLPESATVLGGNSPLPILGQAQLNFRVDSANAIDFLRFQLLLLIGDGEPSFLVQNHQHPVIVAIFGPIRLWDAVQTWIEPPQIIATSPAGTVKLKATVVQNQHLYKLTFIIEPNGSFIADEIGEALDLTNLAIEYCNLAIDSQSESKFDLAREQFDQSIEMLAWLVAANLLDDPGLLAQILTKRGDMLKKIGDYKFSADDYMRALEIRENLAALGRLDNPNLLAESGMDCGMALQNLQKFPEAVAAFDLALTQFEELHRSGQLSRPQILGYAYPVRASARLRLGDFWGMMADYFLAQQHLPESASKFNFFTNGSPQLNDSYFAPGSWKAMSVEELETQYGLVKNRSEVLAQLKKATIIRISLPFYDQTVLWEILPDHTQAVQSPVWILQSPQDSVLLDGESTPIHDANESVPIRLSLSNVLDYLRFFCVFVHGELGPFHVLDGPNFPALLHLLAGESLPSELGSMIQPPKIVDRQADGPYTIHATVLYGNALFRATFVILETGQIEMKDDEAIWAKQ